MRVALITKQSLIQKHTKLEALYLFKIYNYLQMTTLNS